MSDFEWFNGAELRPAIPCALLEDNVSEPEKKIVAIGITDFGQAAVHAGIAHEAQCIGAEMGLDDDEKGIFVCCETCGWKFYPHNPREN